MKDIFEQLEQIKRDMDAIDIELAMNAEAIESIEISLKFLMIELENI